MKYLIRRTRLRAAQPASRSLNSAAQINGFPGRIFLLVVLLLIILPAILYDALVTDNGPDVLTFMQYVVTGAYSLTSLMLIWEASAAWGIKTAEQHEVSASLDPLPLPACTAIIAAYLPNEQSIILETIRHMLTQVDVPCDQFQIILAYNTPEALAVEADLQEIAAFDSRLLPLCVSGSRSKAENINAALKVATGEIIAVYDADHLPAPDCFRRAWRRLSGGADMVQGRCVIRNHAENWLTRIVAIEFDTIYAVSHPGRAALSGTAIFGGSNGYWRREVLTRLKMDAAMLTEDIDISVRSLLSGCRLVHDRGLVSTELAPFQVGHWTNQRKRWAQGWLEVALKHTKALMRSPCLTAGQKAWWFYLLAWREIYPVIAVQFFALVLTSAITGVKLHWLDIPWLVAATVLNWSCGPFVLLVTYLSAPPRTRLGLSRWYWLHGLFSLVYITLKLVVALVAQISHLLCEREWITTPRAHGIGSFAPPSRTGTVQLSYTVLSTWLLAVAAGLLLWDSVAYIHYKNQVHVLSHLPYQTDLLGNKAFYNAEMLDYGASAYAGVYHGGGANNAGQVVSAVSPWRYEDFRWRASLWDRGKWHELPALPGAAQSVAHAVNQQGDIVGEAGIRYGLGQAVLWRAGCVRPLGQIKGYSYSTATALNDKGQIVGRVYKEGGESAVWWARPAHAFLWAGGQMHDLGVPTGCIASRASAINASGQIVGWALTRTQGRHAFLWDKGVMHDLGTLPGGRFSDAVAINDKGQIAGDSDDALGKHHTVLWENGRIHDLGSLPGCEWCHTVAMNASGQILGDSGGQSYAVNGRAFVCDVHQGMRYVDLPKNTNWRIQRVLDIRNDGQIIALGVCYAQRDPSYDHRLFLLTPTVR